MRKRHSFALTRGGKVIDGYVRNFTKNGILLVETPPTSDPTGG
jgi:hypothetical protein